MRSLEKAWEAFEKSCLFTKRGSKKSAVITDKVRFREWIPGKITLIYCFFKEWTREPEKPCLAVNGVGHQMPFAEEKTKIQINYTALPKGTWLINNRPWTRIPVSWVPVQCPFHHSVLYIRAAVFLFREKDDRPRQRWVFEENSLMLWELVSFCLRPAAILGSQFAQNYILPAIQIKRQGYYLGLLGLCIHFSACKGKLSVHLCWAFWT